MYQSDYPVDGAVAQFMYRVYGWMSLALIISAAIAYYVSGSPEIYALIQHNNFVLIGIIIAQLALVVVLSMFILKMSFLTAMLLFMAYAASVGLTLSVIFLVYTMTSIFATFVITAGMFGTMCLYGYFTRTDLTRMGNILLMALFGLILAMLVNFFLKSAAMDFVLSGLGVLIFTGLTAYDAQKIKMLGQQMIADHETMNKVAVLGALTLYLDFINLFLFLLRFMGKQKD